MFIAECIKSGQYLMPAPQYKRLPPHVQELFLPVYNGSVLMYLYKEAAASTPYSFVRDRRDEDDNVEFSWLVLEFINAISSGETVHLLYMDADEDFTYGALCTACATLQESEFDWILNREYDSTYSLYKITEAITNDEDC